MKDKKRVTINQSEDLKNRKKRIWFFDLDNTLHDASNFCFQVIDRAMTNFIATRLQVSLETADALRLLYWQKYGATLVGLTKHHAHVISAKEFLRETHALPALAQCLRAHRADLHALKTLPGRKFLLTNSPCAYARRILRYLGLSGCFEQVISIESMCRFNQQSAKPDARMLKMILARHKLEAKHCVLVDDALINHKKAHALGMKTVWMQRYIGGNSQSTQVGVRTRYLPSFVHARIKALHRLKRFYV